MDRMWINSILGEADKCHIPNILLPRVPHCRWVTEAMGTQSQIHTHIYNHTFKAKGTHANTWKMHTKPPIWACGIVTFLSDIPAPVCQRGRQLEGHYGWQQWLGDDEGGRRAESQIWHVTWSNREDLRLIRFHIGCMVLWLQNARYGSEIRLRL